jgi:hypothetical protein
MNRFANLAEKWTEPSSAASPDAINGVATPPSRIGRKAISGYFAPEMSLALHHCARKNGLSLQDLMSEAFNDVLRKYGDSPVG